MIRRSTFLAAFLLLSTAAGSAAEKLCASPEYKTLDFWVGEWEVVSPTGERQGTNLIEKVLDGCAILEHWRDVKGAEGKSFFYYHPPNRAWKQVWVTNQGATKEKMLLADFAGPGVRFQGELPRKDGKGTYLDRTTITPLEGGRVRQRIEISLDQGKSWDARFAWEGIYVPRRR